MDDTYRVFMVKLSTCRLFSSSNLSLILGVHSRPDHLSHSFNPPFPLVDSAVGLGRAGLPAAKHFDAVYTVKQPCKYTVPTNTQAETEREMTMQEGQK